MSSPLSAAEVLNREFLELRSRVLELAAALDRLERAGGSVQDDPRMQRLHEALQLLIDDKEGQQYNRAEQVQLTFSRSYDERWKTEFRLALR